MEAAASPVFSSSTAGLLGRSRLARPHPRFPAPLLPVLLISRRIPSEFPGWAKTGPAGRLRHSLSDITESVARDPWLTPLKTVSFGSLLDALSAVRPADVFKWAAALSVSVSAVKWAVDPYSLAYLGVASVQWPWIAAVSLAVYGTYLSYRRARGEGLNTAEQVAVSSAAIGWLTLVPPAALAGALDGWPVVFFFVYHLVFFSTSILRKLQEDGAEYRSLPGRTPPEWDPSPPGPLRAAFCAGVWAAHWLAAVESPGSVPGGWRSALVSAAVVAAVLVHYNSTYYLLSYSEELAYPTGVARFGPYRWVRHPVYLSNALTLAVYFAAVRAPVSAALVVAVCLGYYGRKAEREEEMMMRRFPKEYGPYRDTVRWKFIPFVY